MNDEEPKAVTRKKKVRYEVTWLKPVYCPKCGAMKLKKEHKVFYVNEAAASVLEER